MTPLRRYNFSVFTSSIGLSITPTQLLFTNTLVLFPRYSGLHSIKILIGVLPLNQLIIGKDELPLLI